MGNGSSKKSGNKGKGSDGKKKQMPEINHDPEHVPQPAPRPSEGHVITNREIQDAISRGNVFTALVYYCCLLRPQSKNNKPVLNSSSDTSNM